ncbi:MAG: hypothetical protein WCY77_11815 [Weeksellaceae bacterium]
MEQSKSSCIRSVGGEKICSYCEEKLIKYGKTKQQNQRFKCTACNKTQVEYIPQLQNILILKFKNYGFKINDHQELK